VKERCSERGGGGHSLVYFLLRGNGPSYGQNPYSEGTVLLAAADTR
jgi:hypothetical protein